MRSTSVPQSFQAVPQIGLEIYAFPLATPNPRTRLSGLRPCGVLGSSVIEFGAPQFDVVENQGLAQIMVTRTGDVSTTVTVDYFVSDNSANELSDYTTKLGTLRFAPGETQKIVEVLITDDLVPEADENAFLGLLNAAGNAGIGPRKRALMVIHDNDSGESSNAIDTSSWYVREHYHDFLNRPADASGEVLEPVVQLRTKSFFRRGTATAELQAAKTKRSVSMTFEAKLRNGVNRLDDEGKLSLRAYVETVEPGASDDRARAG